MPDARNIPSVPGPIIEEVVLVDFLRFEERCEFQSASETGHLIHLITEGRTEQTSSGIVERCGRGDTVWYHENELTEGEIAEAPFSFFTVNFKASVLPPPLPEQRVRKTGKAALRCMEDLLETWRSTKLPPTLRHLRLHALLLELVLELLSEPALAHRVDRPTLIWWTIENRVRLDLGRPYDMETIARMAGCSRRTVVRACHRALGMPPMKRIKQLRLSYARSLVQHSTLRISEIAQRVGYERVHELSRDYRQHFEVTATGDRRAGPDYAKVRPRNPNDS